MNRALHLPFSRMAFRSVGRQTAENTAVNGENEQIILKPTLWKFSRGPTGIRKVKQWSHSLIVDRVGEGISAETSCLRSLLTVPDIYHLIV